MKRSLTLSLLGSAAAALFAVSPALASGGGGGGTTTSANPLPTTPPAPGITLRESFGPGLSPDFVRPQSGNGKLRQVFAGTDLSGFWLEYPGSKNEEWTTPAGGWHFAFASLNPDETLPSPIQPSPFNGIITSDWQNGTPVFPDAIIPFKGMTSRYSVSAETFPPPVDGAYSAVGLTTSSATQANLPSNGQIWVRLSQIAPFNGSQGQYEVLAGKQVLASGPAMLSGFNPVTITIDPAAQTVSVAVNGTDVGTWPDRVTPSFIAFEGQGWADDLVVRTLP